MGDSAADRAGGPFVFTRLKHPHLLAAALAVLISSVFIAAVKTRAHHFEAENEARVARYFFPEKLDGTSLQRLAFRMKHFLPVYGSSELGSYKLQKAVKTVPGAFFIRRPTGFATFPVGRGGTTPLVMLQDIAAVGRPVEGHKVVLILSPGWFSGKLKADQYEGNSSMLHTGSLIFGDLSDGLKHDVARRLMEFPHALQKSDLLWLTAQLYARGGTWSLRLAHAMTPLGKCWLWFLGLMDDAGTVEALLTPPEPFADPPPPEREKVHWNAAMEASETLSTHQALGDMAGNAQLVADVAPPIKPRVHHNWQVDPPETNPYSTSDVWRDYDLLLRVLHESGAKALILSMPLDGPTRDREGAPFAIRKYYYDRVRGDAAKYGFPARTFEEHEYDRNFLIQRTSHLTEKGWLFFDETIDSFYHDKLESQPAVSPRA